MRELVGAIEQLHSWFQDEVLPLWFEIAYDEKQGGFYETVDFAGAPVSGPRRVRVQSRQVYTFTKAGALGWHPGAEDIAAEGFSFLVERACPDHAKRGCVHRLSASNAISDMRRDLYDQAFLLLACAARIKTSGDPQAVKIARNTFDFLDTELKSDRGGWRESDMGELPRRQNPHMHLLEAFMALYEATNEERYLDAAKHVTTELFPKFVDQHTGLLFEFFDQALNIDTDRIKTEPGHMFEWVWLLNRLNSLAAPHSPAQCKPLFFRAYEIGADESFYGLINNSYQPDEKMISRPKRLWPQTEYLRACCVMASIGNAAVRDRIAPLIATLFETYFKVEKSGLWIDEFDAKGAPISTDVPASILYHIIEAVFETKKLLDSLGDA
ncbi:MAG: AGE family epimerase/isomerase [Pseudomonadota bacterium]